MRNPDYPEKGEPHYALGTLVLRNPKWHDDTRVWTVVGVSHAGSYILQIAKGRPFLTAAPHDVIPYQPRRKWCTR